MVSSSSWADMVVYSRQLPGREAEIACETVDIALGQVGFSDFAAVGAGAAVDLFLGFLGYAAEAALGKIVSFHMTAETLVLLELFFAQALDLNERSVTTMTRLATENVRQRTLAICVLPN